MDSSEHTVYCFNSFFIEIMYFIKYQSGGNVVGEFEATYIENSVYKIFYSFKFSDSQIISLCDALNKIYGGNFSFCLKDYESAVSDLHCTVE